MNKIFVIILVLLVSFKSPAQDKEILKSITVTADYITCDHLGNLYIINGNTITKYDPDGLKLCSYSKNETGNISFVDVSNPMKILLFYKDFSLLEFLDNTLTINKSPISLKDIEAENSTLACGSYNNGFWIYNPAAFQLFRYDENLKITGKSSNISFILDGEITPNFLTEKNNQVFLNDPLNGILVFDRFGTYLKTLPVKGLNGFQIIDNTLFYISQNTIYSIDLQTFETKTLIENLTDIKNFGIQNDRLFLQKTDCVEVFKL